MQRTHCAWREAEDADRRSDDRRGLFSALLGEARELCDADDVAELLVKAEEILTSVVSELPGALPRSAGRIIRRNGGASLGRAIAGDEQSQAPFDYRSPDRGSRNS